MTEPTRRDFLKIITNTFFSLGGLLGLGGLFHYFSFQPDPGPPTEFDLGSKYDFPFNTLVIRPDIPAAIRHTSQGYTAISLICSHLGCTVEENEGRDGDGFTCPCHGSRYNEKGQVLEGPATKAMAFYRIEEQGDGTLRLYTK